MSENEKWKFVGGSICLDFINTVGGRVWDEKGNPLIYSIISDKLQNCHDLIDWGRSIGILSDLSAKKHSSFVSNNEKQAKKILQKAIDLRESIYRIFLCLSENKDIPQEDIELLNTECAAARDNQKLIFESGRFNWKLGNDNFNTESIIWEIVISAADLLVSDKLNKIKQCPGDNCGWLFIDTSKNGSRQWCDMKVCGNLSKVHRFRSKRQK